MTAITTRHRPAHRSDAQLLRFALRADATLCGGVGLFVAMAADALSRLSGLSPTAEWVAGAALVGYGVLLYGAAGLRDIRRVGMGVVAGNAAFTLATVVVLAAGWLPLTAFGMASAAAFTAATVGLAVLQYLGLRRLA
ncbi:hypothetical protein ACTWP6_18685 [Mycobacterium sp. 4D054]|uniref:hypothetical protein n=1 Tax=Mycobacterium sp. 4D054 TaxID=3457440 RepID=UPI003FD60779